jgi:hypothetical protein
MTISTETNTPQNLTTASSRPSRISVAAFVILCGVALRVIDSVESSFWLDELHTASHASRPSFEKVADAVQRDFHAPLFYFAVHALRQILPEGLHPHGWRALNVAYGLLILIPVGLLAGRLGGRRAAWTAAAAAAVIPFQIHYSTEFRPYALLMLAAATAGYAAFDDRGPAWFRFVLFFAATAIGVLTQFLMGLVVVTIGAGRVVAALVGRRRAPDAGAAPWRPLPLPALVLAGALGGAALVPWVVNRMPWLLESGGSELVAPEGPTAQATPNPLSEKSLREIAQQPIRLAAPSLEALGPTWAVPAKAGLVLFAASIALGFTIAALRRRRPPEPDAAAPPGRLPILVGLSTTFLATLLVLAWIQIFAWKRFVLRYDVLEAWIVPILAALPVAAAGGRLGAACRGVFFAAVLALGTAQAFGDDFEPLEESVVAAREAGALVALADPGAPPLYSSLLWQPRYFSSVLLYRIYAPDLSFCKPELLPRPGDPDFARPVVVVAQQHRGLDDPRRWSVDDPIVGGLLRGRKAVRRVDLNYRVTVWVFAPAPATESR